MTMMHGYVADVPYVYTFFSSYAPTHLRLAALLRGCDAPPARSFRFLELGCGYGYSTNLLAAANPDSDFLAVDMIPAHIEAASDLAARCGQDNVRFRCETFQSLLEAGDLGSFDFVMMHGVYSWVSDRSRRELVGILSEVLKPGGLLYVSYNSQPGGAALAALRELIYGYGRHCSGPSHERAMRGLLYARSLMDSGAAFFRDNPKAVEFMRSLERGDGRYLAHEFMHEEWRSFYFHEVARDLAGADLRFVGSARLMRSDPFLFPDGLANPVGWTTMEGAAEWEQTVYDHLVTTSLRRDVFSKSDRRLAPERAKQLLAQQAVALIAPVDKAPAEGRALDRRAPLDPGDMLRLLAALEKGPCTLGDLHGLLADRVDWQSFLSHIRELVDDRVIAAARTDRVDPAPAWRFNRALLEDRPFWHRYRHLASPVTGNGLELAWPAALAVGALHEHGPTPDGGIARTMSRMRDGIGEAVDRSLTEGAAEGGTLGEIEAFAARFDSAYLPLLTRLGLV